MSTTFGVIGSGWRCHFFLRLAQAAPDRLRAAGVVTRSAERGEQVTAQWGVPTFRTAEELLAARPDYVIVSVPWAVTPDATRELVGLGARVLAETPPAPELAGLRALWDDVGSSGLVQVGEQYLLMPGHAARLAAVRDGVIGEPTSVQISSTHLYHVAVADLLERTGAWARGDGPEPYPLADGLQDHLIGLAIGESAQTGRDVTTEREGWAR